MPDSFFTKKRKRPSTGGSSKPSSSSKPYEKPHRPAAYGKGAQGSKSGRVRKDEELSASEDGGEDIDEMDFRDDRFAQGGSGMVGSDGEEADRNETAAEKRVRLAKGYLEKVRQEVVVDDGTFDAADIDRELISSRLQQDVDETTGKIHLFLSPTLSSTPPTLFLPSFHPSSPSQPSQPPLTSACASFTHLYTANKRGSIVRYRLDDFHRVGKTFGQARDGSAGKMKGGKGKGKGKLVDAGIGKEGGHKGEILCVAASEDGKYLLTGGRDKLLGVWSVGGKDLDPTLHPLGYRLLRLLPGHKDALTSVSIPPLSNPSSHALTTSLDRHLILHSLSTLSQVDMFFGHQDAVASVSSLKPTVAVTSGGRDRTVRWWRVEEEVQLVFRGGGRTRAGGKEEVEEEGEDVGVTRKQKEKSEKGKEKEFYEGSLDCVVMLDDQHFISGGDSGSICLWHTGKKKPIFTAPIAHGLEAHLSESEGKQEKPRWVISLAALRGTDLFASGSWDGQIRLWRLEKGLKSFLPVFTIPAKGFVNSLQILAVPGGTVDPSSWALRGGKGNKVAEKGEEMDVDAPEAGSDEEDMLAEPKPAPASAPVVAIRAKAKIVPDYILVAALSKEPRLGRWMTAVGEKGVKNGCLVVCLRKEEEGGEVLE